MARIGRVAFHDEWLPIDFVELSDRRSMSPLPGVSRLLPVPSREKRR